MKRYLALPVLLLGFIIGCEDSHKISLEEENLQLLREKKQIQNAFGQSQKENEQLKKQITTLSELKPGVRLENLYDLQRIRITKYTNLYDKNKDGKKEKLLVYLRPIDAEGDVIKASGSVDVQLWNLNNKDNEALLRQWHVNPDELKEMWFATIVTMNYRLTFDVADLIETFEEPLTVKVTFTDYLSGKVFTEQRVIKP